MKHVQIRAWYALVAAMSFAVVVSGCDLDGPGTGGDGGSAAEHGG